MERELWKVVYAALRKVACRFDQKYVQFQPWRLAAVLLWAALHDRPVCWACDRRNWSTTRLKPDRLPSEATMSRRARKTSFALFLSALADELKGSGPPAWELMVDGKPLPVGKCSKDPDAKPNQHGRGYKLHTLWGTKYVPDVWEVTAARENEAAVAVRLLTQVRGAGYLYADGSYEDNRVYDAADASGYQLLAHPGTQATGQGHGYQSSNRLRALGMFADGYGWDLYRRRTSIERRFGNAGAFGGGLAPLPNWVRRLGRVTRWVCCKLIINAARIIHKQQHL
ncbi:transposase [Gemmata sp. JC673]|uniref:Transposase n=1 Tax=Gemmata algarum TaxID=2975278 RepID=A0ABU5F119_9BACT|nr:transposase [Gemmata algarum]MDY3561273.1 transposase [Gemmata algarum]